MEGYQISDQSDYVKKIVSVAEDRDREYYNLDNMEHWINLNIKDFILDITHEILREASELEYWVQSVLEETNTVSVNLSKFNETGEQITVKDALQLSIVKLHTMRKILKVMKKYGENKI